MKTQNLTYIGIDIGKATLDVFAGEQQVQVTNDRDGFLELLRRTRALRRRVHYVCEASAYGRLLGRFLHGRRCRVTFVSPYRVRQFAKAMGICAKTDKIDAKVIASYAAAVRPEPAARPSPIIERLRNVIRRRAQLVDVLRIQRLQRDQLWVADLKAGAGSIITALKQEIARLNIAAIQQVAEVPELAAQFRTFLTVKGVGAHCAVQLLAELPELGHLRRRPVASLAGLAPFNWDSGTTEGVRRVRGGRHQVRRALYMAASAAARVNPVLAPFYRQLRKRGKPHRVAMVAVMRKLLIHLNHLARIAQASPLDEHAQLREHVLRLAGHREYLRIRDPRILRPPTREGRDAARAQARTSP